MRSHMTLPGRIDTERQLESALAQPSDADVESISRLDGDILILGAGGKMGPSLARRIQQAVGESGTRTRVWAASRFSSGAVRASLESAGVETLACDLLDREQVAALPDCRHVLFLAGRKFGTSDRTDLTWITNTVVPARVAERFCQSRMVVFSTGNVYPLVSVKGPAAAEDLPPSPVGEYAQSCLGRERVIEFVSRRDRHGGVDFSSELRRRSSLRNPRRHRQAGLQRRTNRLDGRVSSTPSGKATRTAMRCAAWISARPPRPLLNVTGPERISVREVADWFGNAFGRRPVFVNSEGPVALLSDSHRCRQSLGAPQVSFEVLREWVAHWVAIGGRSLNKPTRFEVADGQF